MKRKDASRATWVIAIAAFLILGAAVLGPLMNWQSPMMAEGTEEEGETAMSVTNESADHVKEAIFAGGCFWCIESAFELMPGVIEAISGYTGGSVENPTYQQVSSGATGHVEAVLVRYDPAQITYEQLLEQFWRSIDPTDEGGQFYDRGSQYQTAIFYSDEEQKALAEASKRVLDASGVFDRPVVTPILPAQRFWRAEDYHQDYFKNHVSQYKTYSSASGRDAFLEGTWAGRADVTLIPVSIRPWEDFVRPSNEVLRERLTPLQYSVTQENDTEMPFTGEYWNNEREGIYVDVVSGEPLFSSLDKHDFGTGWPSFTQPIAPDSVATRTDTSLGMERIEVRSRIADSHLGHLFNDSPLPGGLRYCINSAALRFIPKESLVDNGYAEYEPLFDGRGE